ncbi:MAG TPA: hypothetical protein VKZ52_03850 [Burkholderiaceae bacterium]|nr:hypothetical protein [Burkholderiaceae bacterium]
MSERPHPFPTKDHPPRPDAESKPAKPVDEEMLDEAIEETFPASDPIAVDTRKPEGRNE